MHSVTERERDGQTDDIVTPISVTAVTKTTITMITPLSTRSPIPAAATVIATIAL